MKKSEIYRKTIFAVMWSHDITSDDQLEIIEQLMEDKKVAVYCEKREAEEQEAAE